MHVQLDVGNWGLFCGPGGRQLVLVDDMPCGPVSARKIARRIPRRLLLDEDRVAKVLQTGHPLTESVDQDSERWTVEVQPIFSPRSATLVGVLAGVWPADAALPDPPLVGCWEWEIERQADGRPTSNRRTYWDRNLFRLYKVHPSVAQQRLGYWEAGKWASELIDRADQMRMNNSIREGISDGLAGRSGMLRCLTYNVITGYGSSTQGRRHLRLVGQLVPITPDGDSIVLQGFSYEAPPDFHDLAFDHDANAARVDDVLRGVMELAREPMAVVDATTLEVLITSSSWRREEFGHFGALGDIVADDSKALREFIAAAASATERPRSTRVALRRMDGSVQEVQITGTGVNSSTRGRDVVIRLDF